VFAGGGSTTFTLDDTTEEDSFPKSKTMPDLESADGACFWDERRCGDLLGVVVTAFPSMLKSI
jgi:hypothetical protein